MAGGRLLPAHVRKSLFHFAYNCAPDEFEKFAYLYAHAPNQEYLLREIASRGFSPRRIVDVGAYRGHWSKMAKTVWPKCSIIMVEPNVELRNHLNSVSADLGATLYTDLLGPEDGREVEFHVMESGSSVLPEHSGVSRKTEIRRLSTLNSILSNHDAIDLLKIDAQGYELAILSGADKVLPRVHAALLEIALIEVNEGCPILHEVLSYMRDRDFVAYDILELHRRPLDRALFQVDVFFCRKDSALRADKRLL
jgi:FkbM family methyltransferase